MILLFLSTVGLTVLTAGSSAAHPRAAGAACSPGASILKSPRAGSVEVQAKALNDRGDIVGFADGKGGAKPDPRDPVEGREGGAGGRSRRAARLRRLRGVRREQPPRRVRPALRQAGAHVPVPLGSRSHDRAEGPERAASAGGRARQERDQRPRRDRRHADHRGAAAGRALVARRQGHPPPRPPRAHLDERLEHQRRRRRLRLVAKAAQRGRGEQSRDLGRLRQGRRPADRPRPRRRCRRGDESIRADRRLPRQPRHRRIPEANRPRAGQRRGLAVAHGEPAPAGAPRSRPRHRRARGRQRPRPGRRHVRHLHEDRIHAVRAEDLADGLDVPEAAPDPGGSTEEPGGRHSRRTTSTTEATSSATSTASPPRTTASSAASTPSSGRAPSAGADGPGRRPLKTDANRPMGVRVPRATERRCPGSVGAYAQACRLVPRSAPYRDRPLGRRLRPLRRAVGHRRRRVRQQLPASRARSRSGPTTCSRRSSRSSRATPPASSSRSTRAACSTPPTARRSRRSARRSRSRPRCSRSAIRSREGAPVSQDGKITFAQIQFRKGAGDVDAAAVKTMAEDTLALDGKGGVQVALGGDIIHWSTAEQGGAGEIFGILVAAIVLFLTLGVVAMGLPLLNALFAMVVSLVADGRGRDPADRRRRLVAAAGGDDRDRRRHRLRAADPQPLPARTRRRARRARRDAGRDRHVRPRRPVRGHRGRDRDARHDAARHLVPLRPRDRRRALGAVHDGRRADADAGDPEQDRRSRSSRRRTATAATPTWPTARRGFAARWSGFVARRPLPVADRSRSPC